MTLLSRLAQLEAKGTPVAICTITDVRGVTPRHAGTKMLVTREGRIEGTIGGGEAEQYAINECINAINENKSKRIFYVYTGRDDNGNPVKVGEIELFIDQIVPKLTVVVVGGGHVGKQVVFLAKWLGYHVILSDERIEYCNQAVCPGADEYLPFPLSEISNHLHINTNTAFVLATRSADIDIEGLPSILSSKAGYIGVIGSEKRKQSLFEGLKNSGINSEQLKRIHSPIGLNFKAETPEEIALSIVCEILLVTSQKNNKVD